jgi:hypothetical protein
MDDFQGPLHEDVERAGLTLRTRLHEQAELLRRFVHAPRAMPAERARLRQLFAQTDASVNGTLPVTKLAAARAVARYPELGRVRSEE